MSLRYRTLLTIGLVFFILVGLFLAIFSRFWLEQSSATEQRMAEHNAYYVRAALEDNLATIDLLARDWANWDDTYTFVEDANPAYIRSNITDETFIHTSLNLMIFVHSSGQIVFARAFDLEAEEEVPLPLAIHDALPILTAIPDPQSGLRGLLLLPEGTLLVAARPILTSEGKGPARGTLIFGRYLDTAIVDRIARNLALPVAAYRWDRPEEWPDDLRQVAPSLSPTTPILVRPLDTEHIAGYTLIPDLRGNPALLMRTVEEREISRQARTALGMLLVNIIALGLLFTIATVLLLDRLVLTRLAVLAKEVRAIGAGGEFRGRVTVRGRDELTDLARAVNEMLDALAQTNMVLRTVRNINQMISRERDREKLLRAICQELVSGRGYVTAIVVLTDGTPRVVAAAGPAAEAPPTLLQQWLEGPLPAWIDQHLVRNKLTLLESAGTSCPFLTSMPQTTSMVVRMEYAGQIQGFLFAALPPGITPSAEGQSLLAEVVDDIAFALYVLEQEERRSEAEERFRLLAERSLAGVYLIQDGMLRYVNPAAAQMFGYTPEELIERMSLLDMVVPEDREMVREQIRRRIEGGVESAHYQARGLRKDGSTFDFEVLGTRIDYRGRPAILGTLIDITERKQVEEAIRRQAEQREILRQMGMELIAQRDLETLLRTIVERAIELVGGNAGGLYFYRPEDGALEWMVSVGPHQPPVGTVLYPGEGGISRRVWETGEPFWVDDYQQWEGRAAKYADYPWTAVIGVPVRWGKEMLGVLTLLADPPRTFSQEDADLLTLFASQAAIAIVNARLYTAVEQERERLEFLHRLGQRLAGTVDVRAVAREVLVTLQALIHADQGEIFVHEPASQRLRLTAVSGLGDISVDELDAQIQLRVGQGLAGWVALHRQTAIVEDVTRDERWLVVPGMDEEARSAVSVPLLFRDELIGVMTFIANRPAVFTAEHASLLEAAGAIIAGALLNARLYEAEQERVRRLTRTVEFAERLALILDSQTLYQEVTEQIVQTFGYEYAGLMLMDEATGDLVFVAGAGIWAGLTPPGYRQKVGEGMIGWVAQTGQMLLANDVSQEPRYIAPYLTETRAELDVPLRHQERVIGVLTIQSQRLNAFAPLDVATLEIVAGYVATLIANVRLLEQERTARQRLETLYRIGQIVNSTLSPAAILDALTDEAMRATGATYGSVLVTHPERGVFERCSLREYSPEEREQAITKPLSIEKGLNSRAYRERRIIYAPDVRHEPDYYPFLPQTRSELVVPILRGEEFLGNLDLQSPEVDAFRNVDMEFLRLLVDQVAIALENARLYEAERHRAQEQETLATIATALNTLEIRRAFPILAQGLRNLTNCDRVAVALLEEDRSRYRVEILETARPVMEAGTVLPLSTTPVWDSIFSGQPHLCPDMSREQEYPAIRALYEAGFRSYVSLPLMVGGRILGALHIVSLREHNFRPEQVPLLQQVANILALAIENERLFRTEQEQRELAEALAKAATIVSSTLDPGEMIGYILDQVARVVSGDAFNIMLVENGTARIVRWRGYEQFGAAERIASIAFPIHEIPNLLKMAQTGEPILIPDTYTDPDWVQLEGMGWLRSYVAAPIIVKGVVVGYLNVDGTRPHQFGPADAARLKAFATHVATALENARLYQELRSYTDVLEKRVQERTALLAAQYARLEAILHSTGDGIILTDARGEILQANPRAQEWLFRDVSPEDARHLREAIQRVTQRAPAEEVVELPGLDLQVRATPIEGGAEEAAVVVLHDITQFKTLERLRARFISNISHELRTPITTIKTYVHLLRHTPELLPQCLDILEQEADWQAQLVEDVLQVSRLDSGKVEMRFRTVPLNEMVEEAVASHWPMAQAKGLTLKTCLTEQSLTVRADTDTIRMALNNLIRNGIQYTFQGGIEVSTGEAEREGRRWATVTVADTGIGIPKEELPYIFDRFFRGDRPRQMQIPGTGLGLSIVKEVIDRHGGLITVESEEGKGSRFTLWLPLADTEISG